MADDILDRTCLCILKIKPIILQKYLGKYFKLYICMKHYYVNKNIIILNIDI